MFSPSRREQALGKGRVMMDGVLGWWMVVGGSVTTFVTLS